MRVLILDHDPKHRKFLRDCLNNMDYEILDVGDGQTAIEIIEQEPVRILIAEFEMPDFNALDLVNGILAAELEDHPYVILVTNKERQMDAVDCLGPIPGDVVFTPVSEEDIQARIAIAERSLALQNRLRDSAPHSDSLALYDYLTGVLNRQAVYERALAELSRAQREGVPVSLAMIEVHNLETIRQKHGSEFRDQALRYVARATRANIRIYDLIGRWLGSKFLVMLPATSIENATNVVERVRNSIGSIHIRLPNKKYLELEISIGVTFMPNGADFPLYILIDQANQALMKANQEGGQPVSVFELA